jgi:hypothetical protein
MIREVTGMDEKSARRQDRTRKDDRKKRERRDEKRRSDKTGETRGDWEGQEKREKT